MQFWSNLIIIWRDVEDYSLLIIQTARQRDAGENVITWKIVAEECDFIFSCPFHVLSDPGWVLTRATPGTSMASLRFLSLSTELWWRLEWKPRSWREYFFCFWSKGTQRPGFYSNPPRPWFFPREPYTKAFLSLSWCFLIWKMEIFMLVHKYIWSTDQRREARLVIEMLRFLTEFKIVLW